MSPARRAAASAAWHAATCSCHSPRRSKNVLRAQASCHAWVLSPASPASWIAASSVACSVANQLTASSAVTGGPVMTSGGGGPRVTGLKNGSISTAALCAVCR